MKDELKLQAEKDGEKSEIQELKEELRSLRELILQGAQGQAPAQQDDRKTTEQLIADMLEPYTPEQITQAEKWVIEEIGGRLSVKIGPDEVPEITCNVMTVTKAHRDKGLTKLPDGFVVTNSVPVRVFAAYYMKVILDGKYTSEEEKLRGMIEYSRAEGKGRKGGKGKPLHPELEYLFKADGETLKTKKRKRPTARKTE